MQGKEIEHIQKELDKREKKALRTKAKTWKHRDASKGEACKIRERQNLKWGLSKKLINKLYIKNN